MPRHLRSITGEDGDRLIRPLGVLASGGRVYVTDAARGTVEVFSSAGRPIATWGKEKLVAPIYVAVHPETGEFWVSDRGLGQVAVFRRDGTFLRYFDPKLPKDQRPLSVGINGEAWAPLALAFASDGTLYVTETLNGHRLLIFGPDGGFRRSVGTAGVVSDSRAGDGLFQFPNSVKIAGDEVWVADSNNRRIQVFSRSGDFRRVFVTQGLPRGFDFLPGLDDSEPRRLVVVDTLAHNVKVWDARTSENVLTFGAQGVQEGEFSYPNDISIDSDRTIFVADTGNGRIEVWGWPPAPTVIPTPATPLGWVLCFSPFLLAPLLLLLRKRRYFATADFVEALIESEEAERMALRGIRWEVTLGEYEQLRHLVQGDVPLEQLLHPVEHSESDAEELRRRYGLQGDVAVVLSAARRSKVLFTQDAELRRIARVMELPTADQAEFLSRYAAPLASSRAADEM